MAPVVAALFLRVPGVAYPHDAVSPRLEQLSQGWPRLHFSLALSASSNGLVSGEMIAYFLCLHGPQDKGTRFLFRTTLNWGSGGDWPALDEVVEGGVGGMALRSALDSHSGGTGLSAANSVKSERGFAHVVGRLGQ